MSKTPSINRRKFITTSVTTAATLAAPAVFANVVDTNISTFRTQSWQDHFTNTNGGAILVDLQSFALHYWNSDQSDYRLYPVAIPLKEEFIRRGRTTVTLKRDGPTWSPTPSMIERDPTLPRFIGSGPQNPLGTHALNLGWKYYVIHGNNDSRKIGRTASSGCIGLFNQDIEELFGLVDVGCQVFVM